MLTNLDKTKILVRLSMWYVFINGNCTLLEFIKDNIKTAKRYEYLCGRIIFYSLYVAGYVEFCECLNLHYPKYRTLLSYQKEFIKIEGYLEAFMRKLNEKSNNSNASCTEVFGCIKNIEFDFQGSDINERND